MAKYYPEPSPTPFEPAFQRLYDYVFRELGRISTTLEGIPPLNFEKLFAPTSRPQDGDMIYADGINFNPGSGPGFYVYRNGAYIKLDLGSDSDVDLAHITCITLTASGLIKGGSLEVTGSSTLNGVTNTGDISSTTIDATGALTGGTITSDGYVYANNAFVSTAASGTVILAGAASPGTGIIYLRPKGPADNTVNWNINSAGQTQHIGKTSSGALNYFDRETETTGVANMTVSQWISRGRNNAATPAITNYADWLVRAIDVTDGSEDGQIIFRTTRAGVANQTILTLGPDTVVTAMPFQAEHITATNGLQVTGFVDIINGDLSISGTPLFGNLSTTGHATVGDYLTADGPITSSNGFFNGGNAVAVLSPHVDSGTVFLRPNVNGSIQGEIRFYGSGVAEYRGNNSYPTIYLINPITPGVINQLCGDITFRGFSNNGTNRNYADIYAIATGVVNTNETAAMVFRTQNGGSPAALTETFRVSEDSCKVTGSLAVTTTMTSAAFTSTGAVTALQNFWSSSAAAVIATNSGVNNVGNVYIRPNGDAAGGQVVFGTGLNIASTGATLTLEGGASATGANRGVSLTNGSIRTSATVTTATKHAIYYTTNTPNEVGNIATSGNVTTYGTFSDENFKEFIGPYDPIAAIEIIRADPVRDFHWKVGGEYSVGWGAQTSYNVSQDLAEPPVPRSPEEEAIEGVGTDPKEPGYIPWSMDYAKRTPYLWAALTWALDRIDELRIEVDELKAQP